MCGFIDYTEFILDIPSVWLRVDNPGNAKVMHIQMVGGEDAFDAIPCVWVQLNFGPDLLLDELPPHDVAPRYHDNDMSVREGDPTLHTASELNELDVNDTPILLKVMYEGNVFLGEGRPPGLLDTTITAIQWELMHEYEDEEQKDISPRLLLERYIMVPNAQDPTQEFVNLAHRAGVMNLISAQKKRTIEGVYQCLLACTQSETLQELFEEYRKRTPEQKSDSFRDEVDKDDLMMEQRGRIVEEVHDNWNYFLSPMPEGKEGLPTENPFFDFLPQALERMSKEWGNHNVCLLWKILDLARGMIDDNNATVDDPWSHQRMQKIFQCITWESREAVKQELTDDENETNANESDIIHHGIIIHRPFSRSSLTTSEDATPSKDIPSLQELLTKDEFTIGQPDKHKEECEIQWALGKWKQPKNVIAKEPRNPQTFWGRSCQEPHITLVPVGSSGWKHIAGLLWESLENINHKHCIECMYPLANTCKRIHAWFSSKYHVAVLKCPKCKVCSPAPYVMIKGDSVECSQCKVTCHTFDKTSKESSSNSALQLTPEVTLTSARCKQYQKTQKDDRTPEQLRGDANEAMLGVKWENVEDETAVEQPAPPPTLAPPITSMPAGPSGRPGSSGDDARVTPRTSEQAKTNQQRKTSADREGVNRPTNLDTGIVKKPSSSWPKLTRKFITSTAQSWRYGKTMCPGNVYKQKLFSYVASIASKRKDIKHGDIITEIWTVTGTAWKNQKVNLLPLADKGKKEIAAMDCVAEVYDYRNAAANTSAVDFANANVGGGCFGGGMVQEEQMICQSVDLQQRLRKSRPKLYHSQAASFQNVHFDVWWDRDKAALKDYLKTADMENCHSPPVTVIAMDAPQMQSQWNYGVASMQMLVKKVLLIYEVARRQKSPMIYSGLLGGGAFRGNRPLILALHMILQRPDDHADVRFHYPVFDSASKTAKSHEMEVAILVMAENIVEVLRRKGMKYLYEAIQELTSMSLPTSHNNKDVSQEEGNALQALVNSLPLSEPEWTLHCTPHTPEPAVKKARRSGSASEPIKAQNPTRMNTEGEDVSTPTDVDAPLTPATPATPIVPTPKRIFEFSRTEDFNPFGGKSRRLGMTAASATLIENMAEGDSTASDSNKDVKGDPMTSKSKFQLFQYDIEPNTTRAGNPMPTVVMNSWMKLYDVGINGQLDKELEEEELHEELIQRTQVGANAASILDAYYELKYIPRASVFTLPVNCDTFKASELGSEASHIAQKILRHGSELHANWIPENGEGRHNCGFMKGTTLLKLVNDGLWYAMQSNLRTVEKLCRSEDSTIRWNSWSEPHPLFGKHRPQNNSKGHGKHNQNRYKGSGKTKSKYDFEHGRFKPKPCGADGFPLDGSYKMLASWPELLAMMTTQRRDPRYEVRHVEDGDTLERLLPWDEKIIKGQPLNWHVVPEEIKSIQGHSGHPVRDVGAAICTHEDFIFLYNLTKVRHLPSIQKYGFTVGGREVKYRGNGKEKNTKKDNFFTGICPLDPPLTGILEITANNCVRQVYKPSNRNYWNDPETSLLLKFKIQRITDAGVHLEQKKSHAVVTTMDVPPGCLVWAMDLCARETPIFVDKAWLEEEKEKERQLALAGAAVNPGPTTHELMESLFSEDVQIIDSRNEWTVEQLPELKKSLEYMYLNVVSRSGDITEIETVIDWDSDPANGESVFCALVTWLLDAGISEWDIMRMKNPDVVDRDFIERGYEDMFRAWIRVVGGRRKKIKAMVEATEGVSSFPPLPPASIQSIQNSVINLQEGKGDSKPKHPNTTIDESTASLPPDSIHGKGKRSKGKGDFKPQHLDAGKADPKAPHPSESTFEEGKSSKGKGDPMPVQTEGFSVPDVSTTYEGQFACTLCNTMLHQGTLVCTQCHRSVQTSDPRAQARFSAQAKSRGLSLRSK